MTALRLQTGGGGDIRNPRPPFGGILRSRTGEAPNRTAESTFNPGTDNFPLKEPAIYPLLASPMSTIVFAKARRPGEKGEGVTFQTP